MSRGIYLRCRRTFTGLVHCDATPRVLGVPQQYICCKESNLKLWPTSGRIGRRPFAPSFSVQMFLTCMQPPAGRTICIHNGADVKVMAQYVLCPNSCYKAATKAKQYCWSGDRYHKLQKPPKAMLQPGRDLGCLSRSRQNRWDCPLLPLRNPAPNEPPVDSSDWCCCLRSPKMRQI